MIRKISLFSLVLLIVAAIDSIRNLPATALFGSSLIFFFLFAAIVFLIPISLVAAELSAAFPEKGGVYHWVMVAFGEKTAMLAVWLQWINTMVWYPTILSFIAGTAAYLVDPALAENKTYLISVILIVFWGLTLVNLKGIHFSAKVNSFCATIGTVIPMCLLIALGILWIFKGMPLQIQLNWDTMVPSFNGSENWISLTAIMASFLGMELAGVHVNDIRNPQRNFPRAITVAVIFILLTMLFGSLSIAFVLPADEINLIAGVMQVFSNFFHKFHMAWCIPLIAVAIVVGTVGSIINWLSSPAKGLLHAAEFGFLPPFFSKKNQHGTPTNVLLAQAILVSAFCFAFLLVPSINAFYWFLTALSTGLYMCMYVLIFLAALRLRKVTRYQLTFKIPGRTIGLWVTCILGLIGCATTLAVGFFPPDNIDIGTPTRYALMIGAGNLLLIAPVFLFFLYRRKNKIF
jgi:amino acid transporter